MKKNVIIASVILAGSMTANAQDVQSCKTDVPETNVEYTLKENNMSKGVVKAYKAIENGVVGAYKWIENGFIKAFLVKNENAAEGEPEYTLKETRISKGAVNGYKAIEKGVVDGYKDIENGVADGCKNIENAVAEALAGKETAYNRDNK